MLIVSHRNAGQSVPPFKFKLELGKLGFFHLITFFFCFFLIHLFRFYTSVTLLPAPFTSSFILLILLCLLYIFFLLPSVFSFFFSISFLSVVLCPSVFYHAFIYSLFFSPYFLRCSFPPLFFPSCFLSLLFGHIYSLFMFY